MNNVIFLLLNDQCLMFNVYRSMFNFSISIVSCSLLICLSSMFYVQCSIYKVQIKFQINGNCSEFNVQSSMFKVPCSQFNVKNSMINVQCSWDNVNYFMFNVWCSIRYILNELANSCSLKPKLKRENKQLIYGHCLNWVTILPLYFVIK